MKKAAGYRLNGKVVCPACYKTHYAWNHSLQKTDVEPLTPAKVKKYLKGSRPEADRLAFNNKEGGPSYSCGEGCARRFMMDTWIDVGHNANRPELIETQMGSRCQGCLASTEREYLIPGEHFRDALAGEVCSGCERTSTGWEWVDIGIGTEEQYEKMKRLGF